MRSPRHGKHVSPLLLNGAQQQCGKTGLMTKPFSEISPEGEAARIQFWREMPPWRKLEIVGHLNAAARAIALAGLIRQHPGASDEQLRRRLADLLLGPELAEKAYGPIPAEWGSSELSTDKA